MSAAAEHAHSFDFGRYRLTSKVIFENGDGEANRLDVNAVAADPLPINADAGSTKAGFRLRPEISARATGRRENVSPAPIPRANSAPPSTPRPSARFSNTDSGAGLSPSLSRHAHRLRAP